MTLTCWSCRFSSDTGVPMVPFCSIRDELVFEVCHAFEREPGSDECEREQQPESHE